MKSFYLDSNLFIFAELDKEEIGESARKIIKNSANFRAFTSILAMDELIWKVRKETDYKTAIIVGERFMQLPIEIISITHEIGLISLDMMNKYNLKPRDAIHASCMISKGIDVIISEDDDFDEISWIERLGFKKALSRI